MNHLFDIVCENTMQSLWQNLSHDDAHALIASEQLLLSNIQDEYPDEYDGNREIFVQGTK